MPLKFGKCDYTINEFLHAWEVWFNNKSSFRGSWVRFSQELINFDSIRYHNFHKNGTKCVSCGLEGTVFKMERHRDEEPYHLNLYARKGDELILMTRDHILPRALGGSERIENQQVMCQPCNGAKGSQLTDSIPAGEVIKTKEEIARSKSQKPDKIPYQGIKFVVSIKNNGVIEKKTKVRDQDVFGFLQNMLSQGKTVEFKGIKNDS